MMAVRTPLALGIDLLPFTLTRSEWMERRLDLLRFGPISRSRAFSLASTLVGRRKLETSAHEAAALFDQIELGFIGFSSRLET